MQPMSSSTPKARQAPPPLTGRGGPGRGQGRKPVDPELRLVIGSIRLTAADWVKLEQLGGVAWLRQKLKAAKAPGGAGGV